MRHRKKTRKLSRDYDHRRALLKNLARAFFLHGRIKSSRAKIIATQRLVERLISRGKSGSLAGRRHLFRFWPDQHFVNHLVEVFSQLKGESGFTRIRPWRQRRGDSTAMYRLEFSQPVEIKKEAKKSKLPLKAEKRGAKPKAGKPKASPKPAGSGKATEMKKGGRK